MKKVLVLGGTRFFGIHLVEALLNNGVDVTIATRGMSNDPFADKVKRISFDRSDVTSFQKAFTGTQWDVVFDQICYTSEDAQDAIDVFTGKTGKYVFTSSNSVYKAGLEGAVEEEYYPYTYPITMGGRNDFSYPEGKRQAEAVFFQKAPFPVTAVRFPIVLGKNDYTNRLAYHVEKIHNEEDLYFTNLEAEISFILETEAGEFLAWAGDQEFNGPVNACSNGSIKLGDIISLIEKETEKTAVVSDASKNVSPFDLEKTWTMNNEKARSYGYKFTNLMEWLPDLIGHFAK
ncbi:MAG: NAD-dependent epimerase/dehydratase family protein [Bacillota bacterium]|nr:NAD-dependent epimerase/dehydratase family protein [Bacillota bacterium]